MPSPSLDDVRAQRDTALKSRARIQAILGDIDARFKALDVERQKLHERHAQAMADLIATQGLVSGLNLALGEEVLPNSIPNGVLSGTTQVPPALTTIVGSLYDARTATKITSGRLYITPAGFNIDGVELISADTVFVDVPSSGDLSFGLVPSNGIAYVVEFDPDPSDPTPLRLKSGYFKNTWTVPTSVSPVSITTL